MKWLYRILRLFFCPHKHETFDKYELNYINKGKRIAYHTQCKFCGDIRITET